jgi:hypothetical protein
VANSYLTIQMIGYAMLPILHNNTVAARKCTRKYESQFAKNGAKIGDTFMVRKPPRYTVTKGVTFVGQDYTDERVQLTVDQHDQIGVEFLDDDLTLSMDDFNGRVLQPQLVSMANSLDLFITSKFTQVWNATGTPGVTAATDTPFLDAHVLLIDNSAQMNAPWPMLVSPRVSARLSSGLAGRFNPNQAISSLYEKGSMASGTAKSMGYALGWDFYETQNYPTFVTGAWSASNTTTGLTVNLGSQTGTSINITGCTINVTNMGLIGDVVQFAGSYAVNPITKNNTGTLQNQVLTANCSSDGSGNMTLNISPGIFLVGKDQTVSASPANAAQVYVWGTATVANIATQTSPQCMAWSDDGITLACVDLVKFPANAGVECVQASDPDLGLSIMFTRGVDIREFSLISRVDMLYGTSYTRPEHISRVAA